MLIAGLAAAGLFAGCATYPPGAERGPHGTMAYDVFIEASEPGARIEANGADIGPAPLHLKIFGDRDGTFHDFGSYQYVIRALPLATNQFAQVRVFGTGRGFAREDMIPAHLFFDMSKPAPPEAPIAPPAPAYPYWGPGVYYGPPFYGPSFRFYYGPRGHRHW
jgi:hypothetical protein